MQTIANQTPYRREGFHSITPYLICGDVPCLIDFMKEGFDAEEVVRIPLPHGSIMHAEVRIADSPLEFSDGDAQHPPSLAHGIESLG